MNLYNSVVHFTEEFAEVHLTEKGNGLKQFDERRYFKLNEIIRDVFNSVYVVRWKEKYRLCEKQFKNCCNWENLRSGTISDTQLKNIYITFEFKFPNKFSEMVSTRLMSSANNGGSNENMGSSTLVGYSKFNRHNLSYQPSNDTPSTSSKNTISLLDFPQEIIEKILSYLNFKNICSLRLVCRTIDQVGGQILNITFLRLQSQMLQRFQYIKSKMPRRESARRNHHLACECDIVETLHMRLTLLQMSFGKHIERKHCCFFPGEILDEVYNILRYIKVTPKLARPYKVTDELFDLSTMAMEYFKEKIEPDLPEIACFGTEFLDFTGTFSSSNNGKYLALDSSPLSSEEVKESDLPTCTNSLETSNLAEPMPQSNMVLRKRIRKIKQGMKRYNSQLSLLRQDLRVCKRKTADQQKQISEQQKQLAEQQKQTLEYAARLDEYDKKNEEISRKFSTLLQELNKCKTELQYWRSKSPATPQFCSSCGSVVVPPSEEIHALVNQGVMLEGLGLNSPPECDFKPIANSSTHNHVNDLVSLDRSNKEEVMVESDIKCLKRKANEIKETPVNTVVVKKTHQAMKIDKKLMQSTGMVSRVKQEVTIHSRLKHPSILELYTFFEDVNFVYLVLELCHNGELQQYLKRNNEVLSEPEASHVMKQIVEGIQYLHSYNILHRDMSLSNLLLTKNMQIKIADFGLATQLSGPDEKHMTLCGTPNFISPEVVSRGQHGLEVDVWGLGCLLFTILVGSPPFEDNAVKTTLNRVLTVNYTLPNFLSFEAKDLINSLLQKNPKDRIKLDLILEHPFIARYENATHSSSRLTQDSGMHTMSSRRDSAFSDSAIQRSCPSNMILRYNHSDCSPCVGNLSDHCQNGANHCRGFSHCSKPNQILQPCSGSRCGQGSDISNCAGNTHSCCESCNSLHTKGNMNAVQSSISGCSLKNSKLYNCEATEEYCKEKIKLLKEHPPDNLLQIQNKSKQRNFSKLCSLRLFPTRHQTKNTILSILESGEVCVEFIKVYGSKKKELIREVIRISRDGSTIFVYEPQGGKVVPSDSPPPLPTNGSYHAFNFDNLPEPHWKKYLYASQFVDLVKAKTPKVTYYSDKAKCFLMENLNDFEIMFYNGAKVIQLTSEGVTTVNIIDESGFNRKVQIVGESNTLPKSLHELWICAQDLRKHCLEIESTVKRLPGENFPLIVGRRPISLPTTKENKYPCMPSFTVSMASTMGNITNSSNLKGKQISVLGVGVATQLADGRIYVQCFNGEQMWLYDKKICYKYSDDRVVNYSESDSIPDQVSEKIREIGKVLHNIMIPKSSNPKIHLFR
ncbi:hypothetical protein FQA39_LY06401 [Lamprigera yunnana]|nr:hypothetical protein FQA39_LY06401 [Lamprigera yunnana]